ncbi:fused MFS/spermidine synthase [Sphingomonas xinjiangensis]|uniref:SAM-dependent methyltransferase n=1 Tax=Sphingomonas xinjiangensis TaxID=643568 RepID=A0A840YJN0_9SPHN|nr:fused MFS/spermidine synthase [Sphingomonas xinjiangensis]MBB5709126.1 SAM-dependent methyltransferase [Sphingomonas xinjiangensis]
MHFDAEPARQALAKPYVRGLFLAAILTGSFLLFLIQPMVARMALPRIGGAPAVWNSAMLIYQALLLGGYAYAHWLRHFRPRVQAGIHLALLAAAALLLPIGLIRSDLPQGIEPALWVPWLLCASIGPLFFAVSAQAPLLQRWYASASGGRDPYALYAASNVGSFGGLLAYPLFVEPQFALKSQSWLWTIGYGLAAALIVGCALVLPRTSQAVTAVSSETRPIGIRRIALWIALAFVPSGLMLATSTFLTTDIVAVPMLWVLPLGLYLLSFSLAFREGAALPHMLAQFVPVMLLLFGATLIAGHEQLAYMNAFIGLVLLFVTSVALHGRMYALRPAADQLTGFYLAMAVGGALGGVFSALVAPLVFDWTYEYPLLILAAGLLVPQAFLSSRIARIWHPDPQRRLRRTMIVATIVAALVFLGIFNPADVLGNFHEQIAFIAVVAVGLATVGARPAFMVTLAGALFIFGGYRALEMSFSDARTRSYFGVYTVSDEAGERRLAHGTTLHGVQLLGARERMPTTYYVRGSGVGRAMQALPLLYGPNARVGAVGLGTGTLACYAKPGQSWRFFEIDPAVVRLAQARFTFLKRCLPDPTILLGDARLRLDHTADASLDMLALDAFSSDAVPTHLMTAEAFASYGRVLAPNGLLLVHISNRFLALSPVVAATAQRQGWHAARLIYQPSALEKKDEASTSDWIALSHDPGKLQQLTRRSSGWQPLLAQPGFQGWTDDYASIMPVLRIWNRSPSSD